MRSQNFLAAVSVLLMFAVAKPADADSVLDRVEKTKVLTAGTSKDAFPFAYANQQGQLTGYSVDILKLIQRQVEKELKYPVKLELVALDPDERIPKLKDGAVDIVCDAASFTWQRDRDIDFTVSYGTTGTRLLALKGKRSWNANSLANRKIGALHKTTSEQAVRKTQPKAQIVLVQDRSEGYRLLQTKAIDAFADDGILLDSWLQKAPNRQNFELVGPPFSKEGIACMVPENNSKFLDSANYALVQFMQGVLQAKQPYLQTFDRWFGPQSATPLTQDIRGLTLDNMQQVLDSKQTTREDSL